MEILLNCRVSNKIVFHSIRLIQNNVKGYIGINLNRSSSFQVEKGLQYGLLLPLPGFDLTRDWAYCRREVHRIIINIIISLKRVRKIFRRTLYLTWRMYVGPIQ
jgi:hypothetical protein